MDTLKDDNFVERNDLRNIFFIIFFKSPIIFISSTVTASNMLTCSGYFPGFPRQCLFGAKGANVGSTFIEDAGARNGFFARAAIIQGADTKGAGAGSISARGAGIRDAGIGDAGIGDAGARGTDDNGTLKD